MRRADQVAATAPPLELPSASSAADLVSGNWAALPRVLLHLAGRAVLIALGLLAVGASKLGAVRVARLALGGAMAIELFVLWYAWTRRR